MVMFHSYVKLPEGNDATGAIKIKNSFLYPHGLSSWPASQAALSAAHYLHWATLAARLEQFVKKELYTG